MTRYAAAALLLAATYATTAQAADPYAAYPWLSPGQVESAVLARVIILNELNQQRMRDDVEQRQSRDLSWQPRAGARTKSRETGRSPGA